LLLRLAVLLHHGRSDHTLPPLQLSIATPNVWQIDLRVNALDWPLLMADLIEETSQFKHWGITLDVRVTEKTV
jgi:exopolyphosphatase/guanosine-5'-triphosphate,3'-diphosphate pyrophosphatase